MDLEASVFSIKGVHPERWGPPRDARLLSNFYLWAVILSDYSAKIPSMVLCALAAASAFSDDSFPQRYLSPFSLNYSAKIPSMVLCALAAASAGVLVPVMDSFTARERASEISGHWA